MATRTPWIFRSFLDDPPPERPGYVFAGVLFALGLFQLRPVTQHLLAQPWELAKPWELDHPVATVLAYEHDSSKYGAEHEIVVDGQVYPHCFGNNTRWLSRSEQAPVLVRYDSRDPSRCRADEVTDILSAEERVELGQAAALFFGGLGLLLARFAELRPPTQRSESRPRRPWLMTLARVCAVIAVLGFVLAVQSCDCQVAGCRIG